jgi:WXG100 family type VII secretion target
MDGFSITSERIVAAGGAVGDVGTALSGEIDTMRGLLDDIQAGWQSSEAAPRFAALMDEHLTAASTLRDALLSHGESLVGAGQRFAETESAIAGGLPAVTS